MPYQYQWLDLEHTIIQLNITGKVTWEQWHCVIDQVVDEVQSHTHRVDIIIHDRVGMPKGNPIPHMNTSQKKLASCPNLGLLIRVSAKDVSAFVEMIIKVMEETGSLPRIHDGGVVETIDEALAHIQCSRTTMQASK